MSSPVILRTDSSLIPQWEIEYGNGVAAALSEIVVDPGPRLLGLVFFLALCHMLAFGKPHWHNRGG